MAAALRLWSCCGFLVIHRLCALARFCLAGLLFPLVAGSVPAVLPVIFPTAVAFIFSAVVTVILTAIVAVILTAVFPAAVSGLLFSALPVRLFYCFLSGLLAQGVAALVPGLKLDMVVIGDIMLFIPGLSMVNGVRELFYADILTGIYRIIEAFLGAGAIALGYAAAMLIGGGLL